MRRFQNPQILKTGKSNCPDLKTPAALDLKAFSHVLHAIESLTPLTFTMTKTATANTTPAKQKRLSLDIHSSVDLGHPQLPAPGLTYELTRKLKKASDSGQKASELIRRTLEMERGRTIEREEFYEMVAYLLSGNVLYCFSQR
jgi:hypothetical protein